MDEGCCGIICISQNVGNQRDVKSSNGDVRDTVQFFNNSITVQVCYRFQPLPVLSCPDVTAIHPARQPNSKSGVRKTCIRKW
jgi:hypothetical protein